MHLHLTYLEFLSASIALVAAAFFATLALARFISRRRNRKPPFLNYFDSRFDQDQFEQNFPRRPSFIDRGEWRT